MAVSPILALPLLSESQASKYLTHNEAVRLVESIIGSGIVDKDLTAPPTSPSDGSAYIVAASPTGLWAGKVNNVAVFLNGAWLFIAPNILIAPLFVRDEQADYYYNGSAWIARIYAGSASPNTAYLNIAQTYTRSQNVQTVVLTDAATITPDAALSNVFRVTLAGNRTFANPANLIDGQTVVLQVIQDATGSRTISWGNNYDFGAAGLPTLTTTAGKMDILTFISNGTKLFYGGISKAFSP